MPGPKEMIRALGVKAVFYLNPNAHDSDKYEVKSGILPIKRRESNPGHQIVAGKNRRGWVTIPGHTIYVWHKGNRIPFPPDPNVPSFLWAAEGETSNAPKT